MATPEELRKRLPEGPRGDLQHALLRVMKSLVFRGDPRSPLNELPISQLKCLYTVGDAEGQKMIDISHKMEIGLPAVSQIVDRLVRRGLLERQQDPQDRRVVRVMLSESARGLIAEGREKHQNRMDAALDEIDASEIETIARSLEVLAGAAEVFESRERGQSPSHGGSPNTASKEDAGATLVDMIPERVRSRGHRTLHEVLPVAATERR